MAAEAAAHVAIRKGSELHELRRKVKHQAAALRTLTQELGIIPLNADMSSLTESNFDV